LFLHLSSPSLIAKKSSYRNGSNQRLVTCAAIHVTSIAILISIILFGSEQSHLSASINISLEIHSAGIKRDKIYIFSHKHERK